MSHSNTLEMLAIADPDVAAFVEQCGILDMPAPRPHLVSVHLKCVDLDDLIRQCIELENVFGERITLYTARQNGHGWFVKGHIKG